MHSCKRILNNNASQLVAEDADAPEQINATVTEVSVPIGDKRQTDEQQEEAAQEEHAQEENAEEEDVDTTDCEVTAARTATTTTNTADDYAHRGPQLASMTYYSYRMHIHRVRRAHHSTCGVYLFDEHRTYAPNVCTISPPYSKHSYNRWLSVSNCS